MLAKFIRYAIRVVDMRLAATVQVTENVQGSTIATPKRDRELETDKPGSKVGVGL